MDQGHSHRRSSGSRRIVGAIAASLVCFSHAAAALADNDDDEEADQPKAAASEVLVTARRLDTARATIDPSLGASAYTVSNDTVESRPGGEAVALGQVLQQFPGVVQVGSQEIEVRGETNLQYRINGIIVPQGFSDLADTLRARFADKIELVTGALPAQYGLHVGGIVNVTTKNGAYEPGAEGELYAGSRGRLETAYEAGGTAGKTNLYSSGSYLRDDVGLNAPDGRSTPSHDATQQWDGFVLAERILDPASRLSLIAGVSDDVFQLPIASAPGAAAHTLQDEGGSEQHQAGYAIAAYQHSDDQLSVLASVFAAYSRLSVSSDPNLDLAFQGLAQDVGDTSASAGLQLDGVYDLTPAHTLRAGVLSSWTSETSRAIYLAPSPAGDPSPLSVPARTEDHRAQASPYVEDEWRPVHSLTINVGVRFDDVAGQGGGAAVSPRANVVWTGPDGVTAHAGYARYFIAAPIVDDAGSPALPALASATPGLAARPETDDYLDVGGQVKRGRLTLGADAYWRRATDLIDEVAVGDTLLHRPFNFAQGRARGVELEATYDADPFSAWANLALARTEGRSIVTGQSMFTPAEIAASARGFAPVSSDQAATASIGASYRRGALLLTADAIFGSGLARTAFASDPNGGRLPSYAQANASVVYRLSGLRGRPLYLRADLVNALDARYELNDGTALEGGAPQWSRRRTFIVGLEQSF